MSACRICGSASLVSWKAREMFLGTRQAFEYETCGSCVTRQLAQPPRDLRDLAPLYSREFFSLAPPAIPPETVSWLERFAGRSFRSVLDVGCATGALPAQLAHMGITVVGIDPYAPVAPRDALARGWTLVRTLDEVNGGFDLVVACNVLEHALDLRAMLRDCVRHLAPSGRLIVMMPFGCSPLVRKYGAAWMGLDPGRHIHVLTLQTFRALVREVGLQVIGTANQTTALNFALSEAWAANVSFVELARTISPAQLARYDTEVLNMHIAGQGDNWALALKFAGAP